MLLSQLIDAPRDIDIRGITSDSREARPGYLFVALPGNKVNGADFVEDAIMHGAVAVIGEVGVKVPADGNTILVTVDSARRVLAEIAAIFYERQPQTIVAVTGTSGKTSIVTFTQQLWTMMGITQSASLGTLGVRGPNVVRSGSLTTPDTVSLHAALADLAAAGVTNLAMEASSHGLDQHRLDAIKVTAAAYSNLSRDHLDYHETMEDYFTAKLRLFTDVLQKDGCAVLNADDEYFEDIVHKCRETGHWVMTYGESPSDIQLVNLTPRPSGQDITLSVFGTKYNLTIPLVGDFQVMNAMAALGLVLAGGTKAEDVVPLLAKLHGVPGRLQLVSGHPEGAAIYVDYAHKPGAVEAVLNTLRPHTEGRLICLFGCGGNRDAGKRPIMGRIASGLADLVIVTDDNPRHENPKQIRAQILKGAPDAVEVGDRHEAIEWAIEDLREGDVLVVAGKGHEQGQIIGDRVVPFDDVAEVEKAIKKLKTGE